MTKTLWIVLFAVAFFVVGFVLAMRSLLRENREIDKKIDFSKLRPWQDDEEEENDR